MNATVVKHASRSSHGATGIPAVNHQAAKALAKASKEAEQKKPAPVRVLTAEQIATELGMSLPWVYVQIAKLQPQAVSKEGKTCLYPETFVETLRSLGAKPRMRRIKVLPVKAQAAAPVADSQAGDVQVPLIARLHEIEAQQKQLASDLAKITKFLGL